jgi:uncharacterized repeat protein (TIGR01451 family)
MHARSRTSARGWIGRTSVLALVAGSLTTGFGVPSRVLATASAAPLPSPLTEVQPALSSKYGGRAVSVSVRPSDRTTAIVASESGGLFRTTDTGATWRHLDGLLPFRMADAGYAPGAPSIVLALARPDNNPTLGGVWRSTDGGNSWTQIANTRPTCGLGTESWGLAFASSTNDAFVSDDCGLLVSHDLGSTFTRRAYGAAGSVSTYSVTAQPNGSGGSIVDVCSANGHYRSTASGDSAWSAAHAIGGTCSGYAAHAISKSPFGSNVIFAGVVVARAGSTCAPAPALDPLYQAFESDDGGATWNPIDTPKVNCAGRQPWLGVNPSGNNVAGDVDVYFGSGLNFYKMTCTGTAGQRCTGAFTGPLTTEHSDQNGIAFDPSSNCAMYLVSDGGIHSTPDCGSTWPMQAGPSDGYNALQLYEVAGQVHPDHTDLYIGTQDNAFYASTDNGATWGPKVQNEGFFIATAHSSPTDAGQVVTFTAPRPGNSNLVSAAHFAGQALWNNPPAPAGSTGPGGNPFLLSPGVYGQYEVAVGGAGLSLWKTKTAPPSGASDWQRITLSGAAALVNASGDLVAGLSGRPQVGGPTSDPTIIQPYNRAGGTRGLLRISGAGGTTASVSDVTGTLNNVEANYCDGEGSFVCPTVFGIDPSNPLHLIVPDVTAGAMRVSSDGGLTWTTDNALTTLVQDGGGFVGQVHTIAFDPTNGSHVLVGTERSGILISYDGGASWARVIGSRRVTAVSAFFWDEVQHDVIVSTYGRGLWKLALTSTDLKVSVSHHPEPVIAGQQLFYEITVTNAGAQPAPAASLGVTLPPELTYVTDTLGSCTALGSGVSCAFGDLGAGESRSFTLKTAVATGAIATTGPRAVTTVFNTSTPGSDDTDTSNNVVSEAAIVEDSADVGVTRVCVPDVTVYADTPVDCTVYVDNAGPSDARAVVLDETLLSSGASSITNVSPAGCTNTAVAGGRKLTCPLGPLPAATTTAPGRASISYRIAASEGQQIDDTAKVRSDTPDPSTADNLAHDSVSIQSVADLSAVVTGPSTATPGTPITWTSTVSNAGPSTAQNVTLTNTPPAGVSITNVTPSAGNCASGTPIVCSFGSLASGASRTVTVTGLIAPSATGSLQDAVRVTSDTFDRNSGNDLGHATTTLSPSADLSIAIAATPNPVTAGTPLSYQVTVTNNGPSVARNVGVRDVLPASLVLTSTSVSGGSCGLQVNTNTVACLLPDLDPGRSAVLYEYVTVKPNTAPGSIANAASVSGDGDGTASNNSASVSTPVQTRADVSVSLTSELTVYKPSKIIHYSITVGNNGPSDAQAVVVRFQLPPTKTGTYISNDAGCPPPSNLVLTCSFGTMVPGAIRTYQVNVQIQGNKGTITTTATASTTTTDPVSANNTSTRNVTVK